MTDLLVFPGSEEGAEVFLQSDTVLLHVDKSSPVMPAANHFLHRH